MSPLQGQLSFYKNKKTLSPSKKKINQITSVKINPINYAWITVLLWLSKSNNPIKLTTEPYSKLTYPLLANNNLISSPMIKGTTSLNKKTRNSQENLRTLLQLITVLELSLICRIFKPLMEQSKEDPVSSPLIDCQWTMTINMSLLNS